MSERAASSKSVDAYRTISEVAGDLGLPQHVLRFWETRFPQVKPLKRAGGRRFYRPEDVELLRAVKALLYDEGYTIKGVQRMLRDQGPRSIAALAAPALSTSRDGRPDGLEPVGDVAVGSSGHDPIDSVITNASVPSPDRLVPKADRLVADADGVLIDTLRLQPNVSIDVIGRLQAVLSELVECEQLIQQIAIF